MKNLTSSPLNIDQYIALYPDNVQKILQKIRMVISETAPEAQETISYQIPTFKLNGNLVHFAAFKNHIGFYPGSGAIEVFRDQLSAYPVSKGTVRFPVSDELPYDLIREITSFRANENLSKVKGKKK
ncbi:DUF1801 domain-containing protein [Daejeonella sp. H1SJ63]|uniref:iron chaperone n=1 Tax=Daejeonella sp. H1SJ63 TaxID=3034145 RepID=UPI0023EC1C61|nr:DUF1801 domain-containing protein [Daejeonella sp. H1SJ63]